MTLKMAVEDLRYLLNRGYRKRVALNFVANHYLLGRGKEITLQGTSSQMKPGSGDSPGWWVQIPSGVPLSTLMVTMYS